MSLLQIAVLGTAVVVVFKPLLSGVLRASLMLFGAPLSKEEVAANGKQRDAQLMRNMINSSTCPSHAAELRAMAARG